MAITTYLLSTVALASTVLGQACSTSGTTTISAASDASAVASCSTYSGSIAIETGVSGVTDDNGHTSLSFDGQLSKVTGNITATNVTNLSGLSFNSLQSVGGLDLVELTLLSTLSAPSLSRVNAMTLNALPALQQLSFGKTGITQASTILITNTGLTSLQGIDQLKKIDVFNVNNNGGLTNISLDITSISGSLDIEANDGTVTGLTTSFPMLETAQNMTFRNCNTILLPALKNVTTDLGFYGNAIKSLIAPNLTTTSGLIFVDNTELTNISIPQLTSVNGTYQIANNTELDIINGFPKLSVVTGALDFNGNFSEVLLPALTRVAGAFNMQTSASNFSCDAFRTYHDNKIIKGSYVCSGGVSKPRGAGTKPSTTSKGAKASGSSAANHMDVNYPTVLGGTSILAGLLQFVL